MTYAVSNFSSSQFLAHTIILPSNLFPQGDERHSIPIEIATLIIKNSSLLPENFLSMMHVNRSWFQLINDDQKFYKNRIFLPLCINRAKKSIEKSENIFQKIKILLDLAEFDPYHDIERAIELMNSREFCDIEKSYMYTYISLNQARFHNISLALETVEKVKKKSVKLHILNKIAVVLSQDGRHLESINIAEKIEKISGSTTVFREIAVVEASNNLKNARESSRYIKAPYDQVLASLAIAKIDFDHDLSLAIQSEKEIKDPFLKLRASLKIAKVDPEGDYLNQAKELVDEIEDFDDKLDVLLKIIKRDPEYIHDVIQIAQGIEDPEDRFNVFCEIAKYHYKHVLTHLKTAAANGIIYPAQRRERLLCIVKLLIPLDLEQAKLIAHDIDCPYYKSDAFLKIARVEVLQDRDLARQTIELIEDPIKKKEAFLVIEGILETLDLKKNKKKALEIQDPLQQSIVLNYVVKFESKHDLKVAFQTASIIKDPDHRVLAFLEILRGLLPLQTNHHF